MLLNYIKNNKVFVILLCTLIFINATLFYFLFFSFDNSDFIASSDVDTTTAISFFNGSFSDDKKAIELSWNIRSGKRTLKTLTLYHGDDELKEVTNSYSVSLPLADYDIMSGNNEFTLKALFDDESLLEKSVYVYVNEAYAFSVSQQTMSDQCVLTLHYFYDQRRKPSIPRMIFTNENYFSAEYDTSKIVSENANMVEMQVVYRLLYNNAPTGNYTLPLTFSFDEFNLTYQETISFRVQALTEEENNTTENEENLEVDDGEGGEDENAGSDDDKGTNQES